jgi:hypothetical protein
MNRYRETLHTWAAQFVPEDATVTKVDITYDDGYEPTFTDRPESLWVGIAYKTPDGRDGWTEETSMATIGTSIGEMLTALFAIEEAT